MRNIQIIGEELKNMPWQDKPQDAKLPVWRYSQNPIIKRNPINNVARIFNSAVVAKDGRFVGIFRGEQLDGVSHLFYGESDDAIDWNINEKAIVMVDENGNDVTPSYAYDPRLLKIEDTYYIIWCTNFYGASIGIAKTKDFEKYEMIDNPFLPFNRNGVLFPRKINDKFLMLSRPSDSGHTPFGDIFISESEDLIHWGRHRHVMGKAFEWWQSLKVGAGPAPIEPQRAGYCFIME